MRSAGKSAGLGARAGLGRELLHLAVLSALAIAHPVLDVIGRSPAYFVALRAGVPEASILMAAALLVPPAILGVTLAVAGARSPSRRRSLHVVLVQLLLAVLLVPPLKRAGLAAPYFVAMPAAVLGAWLYDRFAHVKDLVTYLSPALLAVPLVFVTSLAGEDLFLSGRAWWTPPKLKARPASVVERPVPVVFLLFDEFPLGLLLDAEGRINARRYPGFAELARISTWYRDATSAADATVMAIPSMLTGRQVESLAAPTFATHPDNLFQLLSRTHHIDATEYWTDLKPAAEGAPRPRERERAATVASVLSDAAKVLLQLMLPGPRNAIQTGSWIDRSMPLEWEEPYAKMAETFDAFLASLGSGVEPTVHFCHLMAPHSPYQRLPSGQRYTRELQNLAASGEPPTEDAARRLLQRAALQVGDADRYVQRLLGRLRETGLLDGSVVVVAADHGIAFRAKVGHRVVTPETLDQIAPVPLFLHAPRQVAGGVVDAPIHMTDLLPTLADLLGAELPWPVTGRIARLVDPAAPRRRRLADRHAVFSEFEDRGLAVRAARRHVEILGGGWEEIWRIGPLPELVFRKLVPSTVAGKDAPRVRWQVGGDLSRVDPAGEFIPALVRLEIVPASDADVLVTLNGKVGATVALSREHPGAAVLLPPALFVRGRNRIAFLAADPATPDAFVELREASAAR